jgi:hypothetical protein
VNTTLLNRIIRRISRHLTRDGLLVEEAEQHHLDLQIDDTLDQFGAASLQYRVILGPNTGSRVLTLRNPVSATPVSAVSSNGCAVMWRALPWLWNVSQ